MKRIGVLTSGGDAPGMNAAVRAVVRAGLKNDVSVIGFKRGYNGLLMRSSEQSDDFALMTSRSVSDKIHRGGTFLMTARCLDFLKEDVQKKALSNLKMLGVEGLVAIGGNGTFAGAHVLWKMGMPVVGVPGTIDNDLAYTDYTIGFDTALNTACDCVDRIRETSDSHERASLVTVMGRDCGDIAVSAALACGAEMVMIPEVKWSVEEIADRVKWGVMRGKHSMIMIFAEGAVKSLTSDVEALRDRYEALGQLNPKRITASDVALMIEVLAAHETRATVLGYIQRGGSPSANDRILASRLGEYALKLLKDDIGGRAVGIRDNRIVDVPIEEALAAHPNGNQALLDLISELS
ncbi:MAG: ATP-dependent 6-phosphofructokinase [Christensenellaceae bacterium]|nr:ATP-dependent 6-phosphofructokinase [Christensenellaceae bacterium]MEA5065033.1 ATP-dependent 6-phosphofructokinase [Eubacteriales bacterium]MEA5069506.1 ATP-dependent 6-phosphofructokinase [Christensenellaceae bacterium]